MMSDNLNERCSVFVAFGGGREGLFFLSGYMYSFVLPSLFVCIWLFVLIFSDLVHGLRLAQAQLPVPGGRS